MLAWLTAARDVIVILGLAWLGFSLAPSAAPAEKPSANSTRCDQGAVCESRRPSFSLTDCG
ncbi:MAG: hypothetical protein GC189_10200 [Alphaproteobacteria bacterium]|nr:hypothetical protein [Alphaproteobacteria bacterium]